MSFEDTIKTIIAEQVDPLKTALEDALKALGKSDDSGEDWIRPGRAARMLGVDTKTLDKYIKCGFLTPCFLPGDGRKDRRFIRREIEELKQSNAFPKYSRK